MSAHLFLSRLMLLLLCWWLLPLIAVAAWIGSLHDTYRLTLRQEMRVVLTTLRQEWRGEGA